MVPGIAPKRLRGHRQDEAVPSARHAHVGQPLLLVPGLRATAEALGRFLDGGARRDASPAPAEQVRPIAQFSACQGVGDVETGTRLDADIPRPQPFLVFEIGAHHHGPLESLGPVVRQDVHRVAGRHHGLQIQVGRAWMLEPEQETRQRAGFMVGCRVLLVLDGESEERVEVLLTLRGSHIVRAPRGDDATNVDLVQHARHGLDGRAQGTLVPHALEPTDEGVVVFEPRHGLAAAVEVVEPPGKPRLGILAVGKHEDLGGREGVRAVG